MMKKSILYLSLFSIVIMPGCFWKTRKHPSLHPHIEQTRTKQEGKLNLSAQWLDEKKCKKKMNGINLLTENIEVLHLRLSNKGKERYLFRPSYCYLERLSASEIEPYLEYDTVSRFYWCSLPALLFYWPLIPLIIIPQSIYWSYENHKIHHWLHSVTLGPSTTFELEPYETLDKYLFIPTTSLDENPIIFELFDTQTKELVTHILKP